MANRPFKIGTITGGGITIAALLLFMCFGTLAAVLWRASGAELGPVDGATVRFTVLQAAVSAVVSVGLAVPVARALARRKFAGRSVFITLLGAPFLVPVIVAVLGLLAVFGRTGLLNAALIKLGLPPFGIYGFHGVVLAHVFFNLPLAIRMLLHGWQAIPAERFRLAAALGFSPADMLRHMERPMLWAVVPAAVMVIFTLCLSSFAVALTLGGGPRATTVELAIYQALRFDFDLGRAAILSAIQFALCGLAVLASLYLTKSSGFGAGLDVRAVQWFGLRPVHAVLDATAIGGCLLFLIVPLVCVALRGAPGLVNLPSAVWPALARSLVIASIATVATITAASVLAMAIVRVRYMRLLELAAMMPLAASALVLGTGLFLLVRPWVAAEQVALPVTALVNATLSFPFAFRVLLPALRTIEADYGKLASSLSMSGSARWRWLILPRLRPALGFSAGLVAALSLGDLGVVALFAGESDVTLPLLVQRLMGAYRMQAAAGVALVLVSVSFAVFWVLDCEGRRHVDT